MRLQDRLLKLVHDWWAVALVLATLGLVVHRTWHRRERTVRGLTITAGDSVGMRNQIAEVLATEATKNGIRTRVRPSMGSEQALTELNKAEGRTLDVAMVQGGLGLGDRTNIRQVAALYVEPLHLLVKEEIYAEVSRSLANLEGKTVFIDQPGTGTYCLGLEVLKFAGLVPGDAGGKAKVVLSGLSRKELDELTDRATMPEAVFTVSSLPSMLGRRLVSRYAYRLVPLPFGEAFSLDALNSAVARPAEARRPAPLDTDELDKTYIYDTVIPPYTYGVEPGVPPAPIHTLGARMLVVAHKDTDARAIERLLEVIFTTKFARVCNPPLDDKLLDLPAEFEPHDGTLQYLRRNKPLIAGDVIDFLEKATTIGGAALGGLLFLWQWLRHKVRHRRAEGFEHYILKVAAIERRAQELELAAAPGLRELLQLQRDLGNLKNLALARFAKGDIDGDELMSSFLTHVNDARGYLTHLILHERDHLEEEAHAQGRSAKALWYEAVGAAQDPLDGGDPIEVPRTGEGPRGPVGAPGR